MPARRIKRSTRSILAVALFCLGGIGLGAWKRTEYQRKADATEWRWSKEQTNLDYCVKHNLRGYTARITPLEDAWGSERLQISVLDGAEEAWTFRGHEETVFVQVGDVLYVADFCPIATGCAIVAYDLKARDLLWTCPLRGNPPALHSQYLHFVNIEADGDAILVFGTEGNGRYIEYVDTKSGKTVGHKKLPPDFSTFQ
jgi:hypothetical protein